MEYNIFIKHAMFLPLHLNGKASTPPGSVFALPGVVHAVLVALYALARTGLQGMGKKIGLDVDTTRVPCTSRANLLNVILRQRYKVNQSISEQQTSERIQASRENRSLKIRAQASLRERNWDKQTRNE